MTAAVSILILDVNGEYVESFFYPCENGDDNFFRAKAPDYLSLRRHQGYTVAGINSEEKCYRIDKEDKWELIEPSTPENEKLITYVAQAKEGRFRDSA